MGSRLSVVMGVRWIASPSAAAACSRNSGEPVIKPCRCIATSGPMPDGSPNAGSTVGASRGTPAESCAARYSADTSCT
eukprot:5171514-Prymnesium_polylepis.1